VFASGKPGTALFRLVSSSLLAIACESSDGPESEQVPRANVFCDAVCERDAECSGYGRVASCESYCVSSSQGLRNVRRDNVEVVAECILSIDCSVYYDKGSFLPCWDRSREVIEPSAGAREFCVPWCTRWFECGYTCSVEGCEIGWGWLTDADLERMLECTNEPCSRLEECQLNLEGQL
jgi:hypothetical protein